MSDKSIKISGSILDNPTIGRLPDRLWRRVIELALISAIANRAGELLPVETIAWYLRSNPDQILSDLIELSTHKITQQNTDGSWIFKLHNRFQQGNSSSERVKQYRARRIENGMSAGPGYDEEAIKRRDNHQCVYCEARANLCVDHAYPIILGGTDDYRNLVCACQRCNSGKAGRTPEQAGLTFINKIAEARYLDYLEDMEFQSIETP